MSRRARKEQRLQAEQNTVAMQRSERQEQMARAGKETLQAQLHKAERRAKLREIETVPAVRPRRVARPGKPLKR